jgi:hypothetical protein
VRTFLIRVPPPGIPHTIHFLGHDWLAKREFHVTMLSTEMFDEHGFSAVAKAKRGLDFDVILRDEFWMVVKGRAQSIIQMCDIAGAAEFYARLSIEQPPLHVTLFTVGDRRGIGIDSEEELHRRGTPVTGLIQLLRESAAP